MNARGQYGDRRDRRYHIGAQLQHILELEQRYEGVHSNGVSALLAALGSDGTISSMGTNRWEISLTRDGAWVRLDWDPNYYVLRVTITDKQRHLVQQIKVAQDFFEKILREKITARLLNYGAVVAGWIAMEGA